MIICVLRYAVHLLTLQEHKVPSPEAAAQSKTRAQSTAAAREHISQLNRQWVELETELNKYDCVDAQSLARAARDLVSMFNDKS